MKKLGWFLGLIFGAIAGVLFAPRKGKELRAKIKAERKKGNLGISPLQADLTDIGREIARLVRNFYDSPGVQDVVEHGRKKVKGLADDFIGDVNDFHYSKITPLKDEVKAKVDFVKSSIDEGKRKIKKAHKEFKSAKRKVKAGVRIGKKAIKEIKRELNRG